MDNNTGGVKSLTDQQREGEPKRRNLAAQFAQLSKVILRQKNEVETKKEQTTDVGK